MSIPPSQPPSDSAQPPLGGSPSGAQPAVTSDEMRAWAAIFETSNIVQYAADRQLRETVGLTLAQFEILARISRAEGGRLRMTDIADQLTVSRSGLTYQIDQLVKRELVVRRPGDGDERSVFVELRRAGAECLAVGTPGYVRLVRELLFDRVSRADLLTVTDILDEVRTQLKSLPKRSTFRRPPHANRRSE